MLKNITTNLFRTMSQTITARVKYVGQLRCESEHLQSGTVIQSDAPTDNQGKGEKFSPTDMCAVSLAECALTTIAILGKSKNIVIDDATCEMQKIMAANPRRIAGIVCEFKFKQEFGAEERKWIEETAHGCPVAKSLHPDLKQTMVFNYGSK